MVEKKVIEKKYLQYFKNMLKCIISINVLHFNKWGFLWIRR